MGLIDTLVEQRRESSQKLISDVISELAQAYRSEQIAGEVREGSPSDQILEVAREWKADLILVGSHGRTGITKFLMGSVSQTVAMHAGCSVLIARIAADA